MVLVVLFKKSDKLSSTPPLELDGSPFEFDGSLLELDVSLLELDPSLLSPSAEQAKKVNAMAAKAATEKKCAIFIVNLF
jgi:hypothetical protein